MNISGLREKINLFLYSSKAKNLRIMKMISFIVSILAISALFAYHGFDLDKQTNRMIQILVELSFGYYVFHYFAKVIYDFSPWSFIRKNWFEGVMVLLLLIEGIAYNAFDVLLVENIFAYFGLKSGGAISVVFLQFYLFLVVFFELSDKTSLISNIKLHPSWIFIFSFLVLIAAGTALLLMPEMTTMQGSMSFIDALFTSVSATCVTGLAAVNTATFFSFKGQVVIMMLMKLGGLNIVSFAYLAAFLNRAGFGVKQDEIIEDFVTKGSFFNAKKMLLKVFTLSLLIELIGGGLIYLLLTPDMPFNSEGDKLFFSIFHSISAFNNGGFSTVTGGMHASFLQNAFIIHVVVALLILLGAFGFTVLFDLFTPSQLRDRLKHPWKRPHMSTILAVRTHLILIAVTMVLYLIAEWDNTLAENNALESSIIAMFQAVSVRSAGLNTADVHLFSIGTVFMMIIMMFIGGNTFSTAGGIKTSTFALICINTYSIIRGKKNVEVLGRTIPTDDLLKAFTVLVTFGGGMIACTYILTLTETHILAMPDRSFIDLLFEEVSAFSTCGYSTGITAMVSDSGKWVLIFSMFVGRLGTLSIIFAFTRKILTTNYSYPEEHIMVG